MVKEIQPRDTTRAMAYDLWMQAPNPMVTFFESMVIGTSAIIDTELDGAVGMNSGIFNNPFIIWGRYKKKWFRYYLTVSFQFHHTQMDGAHAGKFLANLQSVIKEV